MPLDIAWIEEPLPARDVSGHVRSSNATTIPVAVGESIYAAVPNAGWVEYIPQLDPITTEAMKIEDRRAVPSDEPGIGIVWNSEALERMAVLSDCVRGEQ